MLKYNQKRSSEKGASRSLAHIQGLHTTRGCENFQDSSAPMESWEREGQDRYVEFTISRGMLEQKGGTTHMWKSGNISLVSPLLLSASTNAHREHHLQPGVVGVNPDIQSCTPICSGGLESEGGTHKGALSMM